MNKNIKSRLLKVAEMLKIAEKLKYKVKLKNIKWDIDGRSMLDLPTTITISVSADSEEEAVETAIKQISDNTGFKAIISHDSPIIKKAAVIKLSSLLDAFTMKHLNAWLEQHVSVEDQEGVLNSIFTALEEEPDLLDRGLSWTEIRDRAYNKKEFETRYKKNAEELKRFRGIKK